MKQAKQHFEESMARETVASVKFALKIKSQCQTKADKFWVDAH